jgi:hypothetical protein
MRATRFIFLTRRLYLAFCFSAIIQIGSLDLSAQSSPDTNNAAELYREAFASLKNLSAADKKLLESVRIRESGAQSASDQTEYKKLLARLQPSIERVKKASKLVNADWGTDDESAQWIDLGSSSKQLLRALILQARLDISQERFEEAANVCLSAMALSRHVGQDGVFIVRLIEASTFKIVTNFCGLGLPEFPKSVLKSIRERLGELPASMTFKETLRAENQYSRKLSQQNGSPYPKDLMDGYLEFYDQVVEFGNLPPDQFEDKLKALGDSYADNVMVKAIVPMLPQMRQQSAAHEVSMLLFEQGLNILISGVQVIKDSKDPFGEGPLEYVPLEGNAFELRSQLMHRGENVKLQFGR